MSVETKNSGSSRYVNMRKQCIHRCGLRLQLWLALAPLVMAMTYARPALADSIGITYTAAHLSGQQWQYQYKLTGTLSAGDDIAILFPYSTDAGLLDLQTGGANFTTFVFQPDKSLPADGEFDIVPSTGNPSLSPVFNVSFLFSGSGTPGSQAFTLYDPNFNVLGTGLTQLASSAVPEPGTFVLLVTGVVAFARARRRA